jgi:hypothetical protein
LLTSFVEGSFVTYLSGKERQESHAGFKVMHIYNSPFSNQRFFCGELGKCNCMKTKIAVATVSGRACYELVAELKRKTV